MTETGKLSTKWVSLPKDDRRSQGVHWVCARAPQGREKIGGQIYREKL